MTVEEEYEMAVHVAAAFSSVREAQAYSSGDQGLRALERAASLRDAERALRAVWDGVSADNRRFVDLSAYSRAGDLRLPS